MTTTTQHIKTIVTRFNKEFIEGGNQAVFNELISDDVINHTAPQGAANDKNGMFYFLQNVLRTGFPDITVEILNQVAENDMVTTRKVLNGTHKGSFMGLHATGKAVQIQVIDIIRIKDGQYSDHWGMSNLAEVIAQLTE